jgi:hypothetical protein
MVRERDRRTLRRIVSRNHTVTAAQVTAEPNNHHEDPVFKKTLRCELCKSNIHGRAVVTEPLITESNADMRER